MLKNVEIVIFLYNSYTVGTSYIIFNGKRYNIHKQTSYSVLKKIPKNKKLIIKINGIIINNQYGYNLNPFKPARTILIKKLM